MSNEITVTGDTIFYNGQAIATLLESQATTQRVEFVDAIVGIQSEDEIVAEINKVETEAGDAGYKQGQDDVLILIENETERWDASETDLTYKIIEKVRGAL